MGRRAAAAPAPSDTRERLREEKGRQTARPKAISVSERQYARDRTGQDRERGRKKESEGHNTSQGVTLTGQSRRPALPTHRPTAHHPPVIQQLLLQQQQQHRVEAGRGGNGIPHPSTTPMKDRGDRDSERYCPCCVNSTLPIRSRRKEWSKGPKMRRAPLRKQNRTESHLPFPSPPFSALSRGKTCLSPVPEF